MPVVVVHDVVQATAAARAAMAAGRALTLRSPPGVGRSLGVAGWRALEDLTRQSVPAADLDFCIDCADDPGDAHAAISLGARRIALAPGPAHGRIQALATAEGAALDATPPDLDLAFAHDPEAAVARLLQPTQ